MPLPTWYCITNIGVALVFAFTKFTVTDSAKASKLDLAGGIFIGVILYAIRFLDDGQRLQWYFKTDWDAQRHGIIKIWSRYVDVINDCLKNLGSLIREFIPTYGSGLFCAFVLTLQLPTILMVSGISLYPGDSPFLHGLIYIGTILPLFFPPIWMICKNGPLTHFERAFLGTTSILWLYYGFQFLIRPCLDGRIQETIWKYVLLALLGLPVLFDTWVFVISAMKGRSWLQTQQPRPV